MKVILLVIMCCCFLGCAEIHTLQVYGANADEQQRYVREKNQKFEQLLAAIRSNQMSPYATQDDFLKAFGEPLFEKNLDHKDVAQLWVYRYCEKMRDSEKVYLYFDASGKLLTWEHKPAEAK